jgi:hypothetical protein
VAEDVNFHQGLGLFTPKRQKICRFCERGGSYQGR